MSCRRVPCPQPMQTVILKPIQVVTNCPAYRHVRVIQPVECVTKYHTVLCPTFEYVPYYRVECPTRCQRKEPCKSKSDKD